MAKGIGLLDESVVKSIETGVAEALGFDNLAAALTQKAPRSSPIPPDLNTAELVQLWVWHTRSDEWPPALVGSDTFAPYIHGCILASLQLQDIAAGRDPDGRSITDTQRDNLALWEKQSAHENL